MRRAPVPTKHHLNPEISKSLVYPHVIWTIGIDPGGSGGLAILSNQGFAEAHRCPGDIPAMQALFRSYLFNNIKLVVIERVHAFHGGGARSSFKFGENFGAWQAICAAMLVPYILVTPQQWQKHTLKGGPSKNRTTKERSLEKARALYPEVSLEFKADDGKADALHMARYGFLYLKGEVT